MAKRKSVSAKVEPATVTAEGSRPSKKRQSPASMDEKPNTPAPKIESGSEEATAARFLGEPVPLEEARNRWPLRYRKTPEKGIVQAKRHYLRAEVDDQVYNLEDDAHVKAEEGKESFICKIVELFQAVDGTHYFTAQWYYRAQDTVIGTCSYLIENKQVFFSEVKDDNPLDCLVKKLRIQLFPSQVENPEKETLISACDYYYDKMYLLPYTSFVNAQSEATSNSSEFGSTISSEADASVVMPGFPEAILHPIQDRVLSIRENARLQGFPDYYKLVGPIKERYIQVGNAVAVPVARALGFSLALTFRGLTQSEPLITLPEYYPIMLDVVTPTCDVV